MEPVEIGPGCWIGTGAVILPAATTTFRPMRAPAPVPIPEGVTPEQLRALSGLDEESVARLAELDEESAARLAKLDRAGAARLAEPDGDGGARLAGLEPGG
jgi:hypothetical protein